MYQVLDYIESCGHPCVEKFWNCVDTGHILQLYPELTKLLNKKKLLQMKEKHDNTRMLKNTCERYKVRQSSQWREKTTKHLRRSEFI